MMSRVREHKKRKAKNAGAMLRIIYFIVGMSVGLYLSNFITSPQRKEPRFTYLFEKGVLYDTPSSQSIGGIFYGREL